MKKILSILIMIVCASSLFSQNLTTNVSLLQLPRSTDDFQKYQFDYSLENASVLEEAYPFTISSTVSSFDGVGIHPFEHSSPVKQITCQLSKKEGAKEITCYLIESIFDSNGQLVDFNGRIAVINNYRFGYMRWSDIDGEKLRILPCTSNPYLYDIQPTRNAKGLITNISTDIYYTYDDHDRVVEIKVNGGRYLYRYSYVSNTKNIERISIFISNRKRGEVVYTYNNKKIVKLDAKEFYATGNNDAVENKYTKNYKYDSHNRIAEIELIKESVGGTVSHTTYSFNNSYDSNGKIMSSDISKMVKLRTGTYTNGSYKEPKRFSRRYQYDDKGNWIGIEDNQGNFLRRNITYHASTTGETNTERIYNEAEVDVSPTIGSTLSWYLQNSHNNLYPLLWLENGIFENCNVTVDFVVEKDGSVSNLKANSTSSSDRELFIRIAKSLVNRLKWVPASINGETVRSRVSLAWRYNRNNGDVTPFVIKDIRWTTKEKDAYDRNKK